MPKMLEMIQQSAVPANLMRSAARGALSLPASEMLEILVYLTHHPMFGEEARMTLASWDLASSKAVCSDPMVASSIITYFLNPKNWRIQLLPVIVENPTVTEQQLMDLAANATREIAAILLASPRVAAMRWVLKQLQKNHKIIGSAESLKVEELLRHPEHAAGTATVSIEAPSDAADEDQVLREFHEKHGTDIAAEQGKKFEIVKSEGDETDELAALVEAAEEPAAVAHPHPKKKEEPERISIIQKIARMTVGERVQLAVKGSKDERFVLIRDGSKVVSLAVLESPKLSEAEMEQFAAMKNVQQSVLRAMAGKRRFMKQYAVIRQLANNPRMPLDVALTLIPHLLSNDLHSLSKNKNVGDTLRKLALKLYKEKTEKKNH